MPSPLPGMDPYIEHPEIWGDFHGRLAEEVSAELNQVLLPRYVARLASRVTYELVEIGEARHVRPDVGVWQPQPPQAGERGPATAVAAAPVESEVPMELPLRLYTVEVQEVGSLRLVTAIEVLSPVNKRPGHEAHGEYLRKRRDLLRSEAHFIEIDLLRGGDRPPLERPVPPAPYYVTLSRAADRPRVEVWPIQLWERLPAIPVPVLAPDPDVLLDLATAVAAVYERGAYARLIDYRKPPPGPPLPEAEMGWIQEKLRPCRK